MQGETECETFQEGHSYLRERRLNQYGEIAVTAPPLVVESNSQEDTEQHIHAICPNADIKYLHC
jgi:hypothetical protein